MFLQWITEGVTDEEFMQMLSEHVESSIDLLNTN
jgi:hypothetical protein